MNSEYQREWRMKHPEKQRQYLKKYQKNHPDKVKESQKKYYYGNLDKVRERARLYANKNKDKHRAAAMQWNKDNPDRYREIKKNFRKRNPEKVKEWMKKWIEKNKESYIKKRREYHQRPEVKDRYKKYMEKWHITRREKLVGEPKPELCPVCGRKPIGGKMGKGRICVDHCHKTGKIRGWLCDDCNVALGRVDDRIDILKNLIKYLTKNL